MIVSCHLNTHQIKRGVSVREKVATPTQAAYRRMAFWDTEMPLFS